MTFDLKPGNHVVLTGGTAGAKIAATNLIKLETIQ